MKKLLFGLCSLTLIFTSCSQEDFYEDSACLSKEEYLLKKNEEFVKKYGVEFWLDEDNISEIAKTMTVEDLEKFFQGCATSNTVVMSQVDWKDNPSKKKIGIRRKISLSENGIYKAPGSAERTFYYIEEIKTTDPLTGETIIIRKKAFTVHVIIEWRQDLQHGACFSVDNSSVQGSTDCMVSILDTSCVGSFGEGEHEGQASYSIRLRMPNGTYTFSGSMSYLNNNASWSPFPSQVGIYKLSNTIDYNENIHYD